MCIYMSVAGKGRGAMLVLGRMDRNSYMLAYKGKGDD